MSFHEMERMFDGATQLWECFIPQSIDALVCVTERVPCMTGLDLKRLFSLKVKLIYM